MKISQLPKINTVRRDIEIPLAVQGENRSITMGQIIDAMSHDVVSFGNIRSSTTNIQYVDGASTVIFGLIIYDTVTDKFYAATFQTNNVAGQTVVSWTYYRNWNTHDSYYDNDGKIRKDCLFRASSGRLYFFDGEALKSAGVTDEQAAQIRHSTPIEVESEEEMASRIELGEFEDGQLYFLAEK